MDVREIQLEWVKALRSGQYKRGRGKLKTEIGYCCLGVLGCVLEKHGEKINFDEAMLHPSIGRKYLDGLYFQYEFADWNDVDNLSFNDIATIIEKKMGVYDYGC